MTNIPRHPIDTAQTPHESASVDNQDRHFVTALARGLEVLACFRTGDHQMGNQELAAHCRLPKSTVSRLTMTLTRLGYLIHVAESGRYRLGMASLALGTAMLSGMDVRRIARPFMQELAAFTGATVALGVRDGLSMIYIDYCRTASVLTLSTDLGSRFPVATSAMGRACLATATQDERNEILRQMEQQEGENWTRVRAGIDQALQDYEKLSVGCSFGEWQKEVNGIAQAFWPGAGLPMMAISCTGPASQLTRAFMLKEVRPRLLDLCLRVESLLP